MLKEGEPPQQLTVLRQKMKDISDSLLKFIPIEQDKRYSIEDARWILGNILDYNLRE